MGRAELGVQGADKSQLESPPYHGISFVFALPETGLGNMPSGEKPGN
jgi:hypothetical protein